MDILQFLQQFLYNQAWIMVPVLLILGAIIKRTPKIANWIIPWILVGLGIIFALLIFGLSLNSIFQGIIAAGLAVFAHQLFKQTKNGLAK